MPADSGINIAAQMQWVNLIYEVLYEGLMVPMFFVLGDSIDNFNEFTSRVKGALIISVLIYMVMTVVVASAASPLLKLMGSSEINWDMTLTYIRLECVAMFIDVLPKFGHLVLVSLNAKIQIYIVLITETVCSIILDTFLVSTLQCSANLGVNGIAYSKIITYVILAIEIGIMLHMKGVKIISKGKIQWFMRKWLDSAIFAALESLCRNLSFMLMVVRIMNNLNEQGTYWVANSFIWDWLLVPFIALGEVVNKEVAENIKNIETKTIGYFIVTFFTLVVGLITIPAWKLFIRDVLNSDSYEDVFNICTWVMLAYITWIFNNILDSTFKGTGKTIYLLYQSICIDVVYYGIMFILNITNVFKPSLQSVSYMFGGGMILDLIPAIICYIHLLKSNDLKIWNYDKVGNDSDNDNEELNDAEKSESEQKITP